jgi:CubicO group peptidase (beta-lactamase class C family)
MGTPLMISFHSPKQSVQRTNEVDDSVMQEAEATLPRRSKLPVLRWLVVVLVLGLGGLITARYGRGDEPDFQALKVQIQRALTERQLPSLAVAVARRGEIVWEEGFGWADRENRMAADAHTPYSIASISKPLTATGMMVLVQRGDLKLDAPANQYLGDSPLTAPAADAAQATVRRLANHTAGLPMHYQFFYADETATPPPFSESIRRYGVVMFTPGTRFEYANFGYGVLDHLIAKQSGASYAEFMRREVFLPLGMTRTSVGLPPELRRQAAIRYAADASPLPDYDFDHPGASAIYSTAHDLVRFGMFQVHQPAPDQQAILSPQSINMMQQPTAETGNGLQYGLGWFINPSEHGYQTVSHTGGMGGVRTRLVLVPDEQIAVVALCNANDDLPLEITREILGILLPDYEMARLKEQGQHQPNPHPALPSCPPELVGYWAGQVETYQGLQRLELWAQGDGDIHVRLGGQLRTLLNQSLLRDGYLSGRFAGDIRTDDANRRPYHLQLRAKLAENSLQGSVTAISLPAQKAGNALSYRVALKREDPDPNLQVLFDGQTLRGWEIPNKNDFQRHGKVTVRDGQIVLDAGNPATGITFAGQPPRRDYELTLQAKRLQGSDFFCGLTFPVGPDYLSLIIGGWGGGVTGISNLNGMSAVENETTGYQDFQLDRWYRIRLRVAEGRVQAWVDDQPIVDIDATQHKLSIWWEQEPARPLGIVSWYTKAALRDIRLRRLDR